MVNPHRHDELEANLITACHATYLVKGKRIELQPNSLLWLFPDQEHMLLDFSPDFVMWILVFSPDLVEEMGPRLPSFSLAGADAIMTRVLPAKCARLLDEIGQELSGGFMPLQSHDLGLAWWLTSAWNAYEHGEAEDAGPLHPAVARTVALLRDDHSLDLDSLSEQSGISPSQLSRVFKRQAGLSITDFRNRLRLDAFIERWDGSRGRTILVNAKEAGFGSYAQFNRVFRRHMGCSPEAYHRLLRQNNRGGEAQRRNRIKASAQ